jgi:Zn-dependent protease with chaperone function/uncharacterized tellurite resistance protein B-like protein
MDFFEAQARAKKRTSRLVALFVLAVLGTILAGYGVALLVVLQAEGRQPDRPVLVEQEQPGLAAPRYWRPDVFTPIALCTIVVVSLGSLFKWWQFRHGGSVIAESLGARRIKPQTTDLAERRLLNVVEEMAIASGVPVPAVYLLHDENSINAFAAGLTTSDAVVAVTRGTVEKLTRDELQGVVGHEFSHILNGDMRMNVRLSSVLFGILLIGLIGRTILRSVSESRGRGSSKNAGPILGLMGFGLALLVIGYIGYFFGRLIQAAVSRQREFLADASAVQFTRNPAGLGGALKKIGGYALGSLITTSNGTALSHFFFGQAFRSDFAGLWATHPPLAERIRAIEPQFDGKMFEPPEVVDVARESFAQAGFSGGPRYGADETVRRIHDARADVPPPPPLIRIPFKPAAAVAEIGALTDAHFRQAQQLLENLPGRLREAAHDPALAPILVFGLLLDPAPDVLTRQQELVARHAGAEAATALAELRPALSVLEPGAQLPLLQLCLPVLRQLDAATLDRFVTTLDELVHADGIVTPFEFALQKLLLRSLALGRDPGTAVVRYYSFNAVVDEIAIVLSALARSADNSGLGAAAAFATGAAQIKLIEQRLSLREPAVCDLAALDTALDKLAAASGPIKQRTLVACAHVVGADGQIHIAEAELLRAVSAAIDCPMPPLSAVA